MEAFTSVTAVAAPIDLPNVDTDRIIPARFLLKPRGPGYERYLFHDVRFAADGSERPDFILSQGPYRPARILVGAENFACGSSREAAVWALTANGFRAFITPSFGDIFRQNCGKNGALAVVVPAATAARICQPLHECPGATITVDLAAQVVTGPDGARYDFAVDPFMTECLLRGEDEIALTLGYADAVATFETRHGAEMPWLAVPCGYGRRHSRSIVGPAPIMVTLTSPESAAKAAHATAYESQHSRSSPNTGGPTRSPSTIEAKATPLSSPACLGPPASALITKKTPTQP